MQRVLEMLSVPATHEVETNLVSRVLLIGSHIMCLAARPIKKLLKSSQRTIKTTHSNLAFLQQMT